jgi:hypothetical protein
MKQERSSRRRVTSVAHTSHSLWTHPQASIEDRWALVRALRYTVGLSASLLPVAASDDSLAMVACSWASTSPRFSSP